MHASNITKLYLKNTETAQWEPLNHWTLTENPKYLQILTKMDNHNIIMRVWKHWWKGWLVSQWSCEMQKTTQYKCAQTSTCAHTLKPHWISLKALWITFKPLQMHSLAHAFNRLSFKPLQIHSPKPTKNPRALILTHNIILPKKSLSQQRWHQP